MESEVEVICAVERVVRDNALIMGLLFHHIRRNTRRRRNRNSETNRRVYSVCSRLPRQVAHLNEIISLSDVQCINNLRTSRNALGRLTEMVGSIGGLVSSKYVTISEQLAMFLSILSHHKKNRIIGHNFMRSGWTVSRYFKQVLSAVLKLHRVLFVTPSPITETNTTERWRSFKGCLGALDCTYILVRVPASEKARYRNRKGEIAVNVLGVCDVDMKFVYVLSGWESSAADSRALRDALSRPNGIRVPRENYYLCDNGYANSEGFLALYKGTRYHLQEWGYGSMAPRSKEEFFNMKHSRARSVIERAFGLLKARWAILRSPSFYPIKVQNRITLACCLLHNFIRMEMENDPFEEMIFSNPTFGHETSATDYVDSVETSASWTNWRDNLVTVMFNEWRGH